MEKRTSFELAIPRYTERLEGGKPVIYFTIIIQKIASHHWEVDRRYSEFNALNDTLKKTFAGLPALPGKSLFALKEQVDIESRRVGLEQYLQAIIARQDIISNDALRKFLNLDSHAPESTVHPPTEFGELSGMLYGIRDVIYDHVKGLLYLATSDMSVTSRVDSYFTNMKLPWEKEPDKAELVPVGTIECYLQADPSVYKFEKLWTKTFQVITIHWDNVTHVLTIGQDDGTITVLKVAPDLNFIKYEEVVSHKLHAGRVMGVYVDSITGLCYSVSEDKKFKCHPKGDIRGLDFDPKTNYLFTANMDDGSIAITDIGKPGREKYSSNRATLYGKEQVRLCKWISCRQELITGNQDGTVTFWDARNAEPIYVMHAHQEALTQIVWLEKLHLLLTASKDRKVKFWKLPAEWRDKKIVEQEEREYIIQKQTESMIKFQKQQKKAEEDSEEDDLAGWWQE